MGRKLSIVLLFLLATATCLQAGATIITGSTGFSASGFPAGVPADPVTGTFTYSFNNSASFTLIATSGVTSSLGSTNWYEAYNSGADDLFFEYGGVSGWTFEFAIEHVSSSPSALLAIWLSEPICIPGPGVICLPPPPAVFHIASNASLTAAAPEPATLALLGLGLAGLGFSRRRKH